ncbi:MAG TPA: ParB N-terminal domain-containing protein, partial [Polyangiaceae bacterium]|nr:ParB N-terminal domain-containing protein [Polyangiaceae bacterium]
MSDLPKKPVRGLGRGLDALLPVRSPPQAPDRPAVDYGQGNVFSCALERIVPQRGQPRQHFENEKLDELAQSIKTHGLLEPLVVR